ncbi:MAG: amidohydrolase family protein [Methanobacteriaceae archaeon]|nr:amidohydrolase family protein [Methanobacteriaceae archaeon]
MMTIKNGLVLYGVNLEPMETNVIIDDEGEIVKLSSNDVQGEVVDASGCIVCPAFINAHTHIGDSFIKDLGDGLSIEELVKPPHGLKHECLAKVSREELISSMHESAKDMLYNGISTFIDFREGGVNGVNMLKEAVYDLPINVCILGRDDRFYDEDIGIDEVRSITSELLRCCDGVGLSGLSDIRFEVVEAIVDVCNGEGKISAIHVAEYYELQEESIDKSGESEIKRALLAKCGVLVHGTFPVLDDFKVVGEFSPFIVSCPRSNGMLGSGLPPVSSYLDEGVDVCLGSDNVMFNSPDMFREMEYVLKSTRGAYRSRKFCARDVLKMCTINGFKILGKDISIREGNVSDILIIKRKSNDPWLSIVNRSSSADIVQFIIGNEMS